MSDSKRELIEHVVESTKITLNTNGDYDIEHTFDTDISTHFDQSIIGDHRIMCTSYYVFLLYADSGTLNVITYTGKRRSNRVFATDGNKLIIGYNEIGALPLTEEQFFQQSTLTDYFDLELEDMHMIKDFYDVVSQYMVKNLDYHVI